MFINDSVDNTGACPPERSGFHLNFFYLKDGFRQKKASGGSFTINLSQIAI